MPLDVEQPGEMEALFEAITQRWGRLDFVLHSIAFAPKSDLHGRVADSSREGFARAMDISCHSFTRMAHQAEPLMTEGGSLMTMSYVGAEEVEDDDEAFAEKIQKLTEKLVRAAEPRGNVTSTESSDDFGIRLWQRMPAFSAAAHSAFSAWTSFGNRASATCSGVGTLSLIETVLRSASAASMTPASRISTIAPV